jgi:hypothetical protein
MLTLQGQIVNVFVTPQGTNKDTGEIYGGLHRVQIMAENVLKNGAKRVELVDLTVDDPNPFQRLLGRPVRVPVGAFVAGSQIRYFHLKAAAQPVAEIKEQAA